MPATPQQGAGGASAVGGAGPGSAAVAELQERVRELARQLEEGKSQTAELQAQLKEAQAKEAKQEQKFDSISKVNRSQTTLMKTELQKTRRKLAHMQAVASRVREQAEFYQRQANGAALPPNLQGLPTEDEACAAGEGEELAQLTQRWENDILQLQALLVTDEGVRELLGRGLSASRSPSPPAPKAAGGMADDAAKQRISDLETALRKQQKVILKLQANGGASAEGSPVSTAPSSTVGTSESEAGLRRELEAAAEKIKEQEKKLQQLAKLYKKVDQEKKEALEAAKSAGGKGFTPSPGLLEGIRSSLAANRAQVVALRSEVEQSMRTQLPAFLEEAMKAKLPELQGMVEGASREWREKYNMECEKRRKLHNLVQELKGNIRVYVRVRPLNAHETGKCISFPSPDEIQIRNEETNTKKTWQFNQVLQENSTQAQLFEGVRDLVVSMLDGYNVCIFAYGQTGAGKTHSMQGTPDNPGIYMRTFNELFKVSKERAGWQVELKGAIVEVYNEEIRDLLADRNDRGKQKLSVKQGKEGNYVPGLTMKEVRNPQEVDDLLAIGSQNRTVACTDMNAHSSRSHLLVQIYGTLTNPEGKTKTSCITLVDLAGSERLAKSGVSGDQAKEAIAINKSLSALGDVINARAAKSSHTPFRNSALTHLLQDSLSGDSKTLMLLQINPCKDHVEESLCSLQFGARVNNVEMKK